MSQVAGRAGRKSKRGTVVIQTGQPEHWIIQKVMQHDYETFYENEIIERRNFFYPPFYKLIYFTLKHKEIQTLDTAANAFSLDLRDVFKERVLGPEYPAINRINNLYIKQVVLKVEREASNAKVKHKIDELVDKFYSSPIHKSVRLTIDVDPS